MATKSWGIGLYNQLRDGLIARPDRGTAGNIGAGGGPLPKTRLSDCVTVLAVLHDDLLACLKHLSSPEHATLVDWSDAATYGAELTISIEAWLLCKSVDGGNGQDRAMPNPHPGPIAQAFAAVGIQWTAGILYHLGAAAGIGPAPIANVAGHRDQVYRIVAESDAAKYDWLPAATITAFWKSLYALLVAIEVGREVPTPGLGDRILGGIKYAATETAAWVEHDAVPAVSEFAGNVLAHAGTAVGEGIGGATKGFFESAGLTAWLVVAAGLFFILR